MLAERSRASALRLARGGAGQRRRLFAEPDFRRMRLDGLIVFAVRWLEMLVVGVFVYQRTGSRFAVALMTMLRMLPMGLFGPVIGSLAERWQRRTALLVVVASMMASSLTLALLAFAGRLAVWHLAVASFCNGIGWATDNPVRRVMIGEVVGAERVSTAMSIDVGSNNASAMLGPTVGGMLLAKFGIDGAFMMSVSLYLIALAAVWRIGYRERGAAPLGGAVLARMIEGLALVRHDRRLIGTLVITVIFNLFGWPFMSMIPVIGESHLHLTASGIGVLASMVGVGAFCGSLGIALWAKPRHFVRLYNGGVASYLLALIGFALIPDPLAAGAALLLTGIFGAAFSTMQATLVYLAAPPEMRSRMYGVLAVCIGVGPIGFLHIGLLADAIGAPWATAAIALEGLTAMALTRRFWAGLGEPAV